VILVLLRVHLAHRSGGVLLEGVLWHAAQELAHVPLVAGLRGIHVPAREALQEVPAQSIQEAHKSHPFRDRPLSRDSGYFPLHILCRQHRWFP
jgi:hypothetical protein